MQGVWNYRFGTPEAKTPASVLGLAPGEGTGLPIVTDPPFSAEEVDFIVTARGCKLRIPVSRDEQFFGMGLQLKSVNQTGKKKQLRVNSDPAADTGDSHAPVPFFVSSKGYGVWVDTARYATFYFASHTQQEGKTKAAVTADNTEELYAVKKTDGPAHILVDIPAAQGVDIFVFGGPDMLTAVQRYNVFSGGGCLPPLWGLGVWYRTYVHSTQEDVLRQAAMLRRTHMPCDVFGLEPGWQTRAYSCSYVWDAVRFPTHEKMLEQMQQQGFRMNLWEHLFVHPESPLYEALKPLSGDYRVWNGLVPDFSIPEAAAVFREYHERVFLEEGVSGFKFDECDNSDYIASCWSYPEATAFPSGMDGEQMHTLMGQLYQRMILPAFEQKNRRTYGLVRASGPLGAPLPFVLYSDLYDHRDFIRGVISSSYAGILWTPEVRQSGSAEELLRRIQSVVLSPAALINGWMVPNPPWLQFDEEKNKAGEFLEDGGQLEARCRRWFRLRMELLPYLYSAFQQYQATGKPPFRALPLDFPADAEVYTIDDAYMVGDDLLFAPLFAGQTGRRVYLPAGRWWDYFGHSSYEGGQWLDFSAGMDDMLLFVKDNSLLPLAEPVDFVADDTVFAITCKRFGRSGSCRLVEDDGISLDYRKGEQNILTIQWSEGAEPQISRTGRYAGVRYQVTDYTAVDL